MSLANFSCRIIVLHYNRRDLLERFFLSVVNAAKISRYSCKITLLDNQSHDDSVEYVQKHFPEVDVYIAKENKVLCSFNEYLKRCFEDIVILLNNDMELDQNFVDPLIEPFLDDGKVFFVSTSDDRAIASFRYGLLAADIHYPGHEILNRRKGFTLSAGVAAFDRKKFLELGGYDEIFLPGRYEDVDLCYRGWKNGWKGIYQPESKKVHLGGASFDKDFDSYKIQAMVFRNSILFMIKNVTDPFMFFLFLFWLPWRLLFSVFTRKWFFWDGFFQVLPKLHCVLKKRFQTKKYQLRSDRTILNEINYSQKQLLQTRDPRKAFVNFLGQHLFWQKVFMKFGFFTLRLFFPLQYLLLRELMKCASILDLGCGAHSMVPIVPTWIYTVGIEIFRPSYDEAMSKKRHTQYIHADILDIDIPEKSFDAVVLLDVLEHIPKEKAQEILVKMEKWARNKVVVFTPNGFLPQKDFNQNPYMDHTSGWEVHEFLKRGYKVFGVRGLKQSHVTSGKELSSFFAQWFTYSHPESAFQLFCVKEL